MSEVSNLEEAKGKTNLMDYLPKWYNENKIMGSLQGALSVPVDELKEHIEDVFSQLFVETATWGLDLWERELGIEVDKNKTYENRRKLVLAKIRGVEITTPKVLKSLAELFSGGEVVIKEFSEKYHFIVRFLGVRGIPPSVSDLRSAIEEIKPAHLTFSFEYSFFIWNEASTYIWNEMKKMTWNEARTATPKYLQNTWDVLGTAKVEPTWEDLKTASWGDFRKRKIN